MGTLSQFMITAHRDCDQLFSEAESAASANNMSKAKKLWQCFVEEAEAHFGLEENTLFPTFESVTGNTAGPTQVMRGEHSIMRELFGAVSEALIEGGADAALSEMDSCMIFMQQHNMKEEQMLYPMMDQCLSESDWRGAIASTGTASTGAASTDGVKVAI